MVWSVYITALFEYMSVDRYHSLSKKQPPSQPSTTAKPYLSTELHSPCPQTQQFHTQKSSSLLTEPLYIHHLTIDYGRLTQPVYYKVEGGKENKVVKFSDEVEESENEELGGGVEMVTKRVTGISLWTNCQDNARSTEKKIVTRVPRVELGSGSKGETARVGAKAELKKDQVGAREMRRSGVKLQSVRAYEDSGKREQARKRLHSRIVKMMVAGGQSKTRVICYPDNSDYLQLWNPQ